MFRASEYRYRAFALRQIARIAPDAAGRERLYRIAKDYDRAASGLEHRSVCAAPA